jgi:predicted DNA-binding transcriptional regulator YafY
MLNQTSISEYFRNMFTSYASLPQDQREKIIFKNQYEEIMKAIAKKRKIIFTTKKNHTIHEASPYALVSSKEETHYYLLAKYNSLCKTYRLSRLENISLLKESIDIEDDKIDLFNKMIEHGPQFNYEKDEETIIIKLTNRGKEMYKTYYTHRPKYDFVEGDYYYFSCSYSQISLYFRRFGKEAYVVAPKVLQMQLYKFYKNGVNHYVENHK